MIFIKKFSREIKDYESIEEYEKTYENSVAHSYDEYIQNGHNWCWCLVGNVKECHIYGENKELRYGTKQFRSGAKLYLAPVAWGDGYENIIVIGVPRHKKNYIEVITKSCNICNFRLQKVYKPAILKRMCNSKHMWWGDTDEDENNIRLYIDSLLKRN